MSDTLHISPVNDLVEHDTSSHEAVCVCGPNLEVCPGGWLIVHHSLDNREASE